MTSFALFSVLIISEVDCVCGCWRLLHSMALSFRSEIRRSSTINTESWYFVPHLRLTARPQTFFCTALWHPIKVHFAVNFYYFFILALIPLVSWCLHKPQKPDRIPLITGSLSLIASNESLKCMKDLNRFNGGVGRQLLQDVVLDLVLAVGLHDRWIQLAIPSRKLIETFQMNGNAIELN